MPAEMSFKYLISKRFFINWAVFGLNAACAIIYQWSFSEFCWSVWVAGICFSWFCLFSACVQIILSARSDKAFYEAKLPLLKKISGLYFLIIVVLAVIFIGWIGFYVYGFIFALYGLFLSVFAQMQPYSLFGRDGYINSDFFVSFAYLVMAFWPMVVGVILGNFKSFVADNPWERLVRPFLSREIVKMHVFTLCLPFVALISWIIFRDRFQPVAIILLMALLYLFNKKGDEVILEAG